MEKITALDDRNQLRMKISDLCEELLNHIFTFLSPRNALLIQLVSKQWNQIASHDCLWRNYFLHTFPKSYPHLKHKQLNWKLEFFKHKTSWSFVKYNCSVNRNIVKHFSNNAVLQTRILVLGDSGCDKSSATMIRCITCFESPMIGVSYQRFIIHVGDSQLVQMVVWDTGGKSQFWSLSKNFIRACDGCILTYDVSDPRSFDAVDQWRREIERQRFHKLPMVLVGLKRDLKRRRVTSTEMATKYAKKHLMGYMETECSGDCSSLPFFLFAMVASRAVKAQDVYKFQMEV